MILIGENINATLPSVRSMIQNRDEGAISGLAKRQADAGMGFIDVNVGTGTMDRDRWGHIVDRFIADLGNYDFPGHRLDVRENIKFEGRRLAHWIHSNYPESTCVLSVEFKKFYMDEWTGVCDIEQTQALRDALQSTVPGILQELDKMR